MELIETIGNTPLIDLSGIMLNESNESTQSRTASQRQYRYSQDISIVAKCEYLNPTGSIKDRIVDYMVKEAEKSGLLKPGDTLIESTSGNTGAAVAMIAALKGYHALLVIPDRVSQEKKAMLEALGASVEVMPSGATLDSAEHYTVRAQHLANTLPNSFYLNQYHSPHNALAHYYTTGPEIWEQTRGDIDIFISVIGSGGTISGIGRYLKSQKPTIKIIGVDPVGSVYYPFFANAAVETLSSSRVEGAGSDHIGAAVDFSVVDAVLSFKDEDAFCVARKLCRKSGLLLGGSSGANLWAALKIAKEALAPTRIVTLLPDSGIKYLSKFYNDQWMLAQKFNLS